MSDVYTAASYGAKTPNDGTSSQYVALHTHTIFGSGPGYDLFIQVLYANESKPLNFLFHNDSLPLNKYANKKNSI